MSKVSIAIVVECVAMAFDARAWDLRSARRHAPLARARHAAYLLACELSDFGPTVVGRYLGGRDHATVSHGLQRAREMLAEDQDFSDRVEAARQAAVAVARSSLAAMFSEVDAVAAAGRVCADPQREVTRVSSATILAVATRVLDLEDIAAATFQLLLKIDEIARLRTQRPVDRARQHQIASHVLSLTVTISSALATLGYPTLEEAEDNDRSTAQSVA